MLIKHMRFKGELKRKCLSCGNMAIQIGYWDEELDFYIYYEEKFLCGICLKKSSFFYEKIKNFTETKWRKIVKV